jgi:hypothetical protein
VDSRLGLGAVLWKGCLAKLTWGPPCDATVPVNRLRPTYGARHVRTILVKQAVNPVLPSSAALVAHEAHHLLFGRSLTERIGTVGHRHNHCTPQRSFHLRCRSLDVDLFAHARRDENQLRRIIPMRPYLPPGLQHKGVPVRVPAPVNFVRRLAVADHQSAGVPCDRTIPSSWKVDAAAFRFSR